MSWNYNYEKFSNYHFGNREALLDDPDLVTLNGETCWASAIWFWMEEKEHGGWCMSQAEWPYYDQCKSSCPDGPSRCPISECS